MKAKETVILLAQKQDDGDDNKAFIETYIGKRTLVLERTTVEQYPIFVKDSDVRGLTMLAFLSVAQQSNNTKVLIAAKAHANIVVLAHLMHDIHEDIVEVGANKGLKVNRQTSGLVCHLEALKAFLCPHMHGATRLAYARCNKRNQGRRRSRAFSASESAVKSTACYMRSTDACHGP